MDLAKLIKTIRSSFEGKKSLKNIFSFMLRIELIVITNKAAPKEIIGAISVDISPTKKRVNTDDATAVQFILNKVLNIPLEP